ncbi:hypothetical protein ACOSP7_032069 [Xanthoceras sorbifolium]
MSVANDIKSTLPKTKSAKEFMNFMEEHSQTTDKSLARTLIGTLTTMKFDGSRTIHEIVIEMTNIATKLKSLEMNVDENFLNANELHNMFVHEETRLKNQGTHSIHLVNDQGARKKTGRKHGKVVPLMFQIRCKDSLRPKP